MSDFSESFHLVAMSVDAGRELLERARMGGWVFPAVAGCVTIVVDPVAASGPGMRGRGRVDR